MPKYKLTITEIEKVTPTDTSACSSYDKQTVIYDQTLDRLDIAKVVIAANECIALTQGAPAAR